MRFARQNCELKSSSEEENPALDKKVSVSRPASIDLCFRLAPRGPLI